MYIIISCCVKVLTPLAAFNDPEAVINYAEGPPRMVPGFADMQRMTSLLLAEVVPENGRVLVLGGGGGLELKVFATTHPNWKFVVIDPSDAMLNLAKKYLADINSDIELKKGYISDAPKGPYDGATCILTMHFMNLEEREKTLIEIRNHLKPGAPFVMVHMSIPESDLERTIWFSRYAAFGISSGMPAQQIEGARAALETKLNIFSPKHEEIMLHDAGFTNISQFYSGFTFRGWVSYA
ncbi:MAG: class SAM-dependent methyltransferase [Burkholderiales bacterium]|jgi:tRNA (cmo5U34)-methyltransferase|nr:class SAM-dependent methyltransferase [Burkholderiales bacterium]